MRVESASAGLGQTATDADKTAMSIPLNEKAHENALPSGNRCSPRRTHTRAHTCASTHTNTRTNTRILAHSSTHSHKHIHTHTQNNKRTHTGMHTHTHTYTHAHIHPRTRTCAQNLRLHDPAVVRKWCFLPSHSAYKWHIGCKTKKRVTPAPICPM